MYSFRYLAPIKPSYRLLPAIILPKLIQIDKLFHPPFVHSSCLPTYPSASLRVLSSTKDSLQRSHDECHKVTKNVPLVVFAFFCNSLSNEHLHEDCIACRCHLHIIIILSRRINNHRRNNNFETKDKY